jgi:hypothetical protein
MLTGLALLTVALTQCGPKSDLEADKAAVRSLVTGSAWFDASTTTDTTRDTTGLGLDPDTVLVWWRGAQTHNQPTVEVSISGDSGFVDWSRNNFGDLNLLLKAPDTSWQLWVKKVFETAQLRGVFLRSGNSDDSLRGWQLKGISLARGRSDSTHTVTIDSVRIMSVSQPNLVIVDPLNTYYRLDSLPFFAPGEQVTITVYTNVPDGNVFLQTFEYWGIIPIWIRLPFRNDGNGVYVGSWPAQRIPAPRFAIFDVMDHRTLYTPDYGYDFSGWLFPYRIKAP